MAPPIRSLPPLKKRKTNHPSTSTASQIQALEAEITTAVTQNTSLNPLADLLGLALKTTDAHDVSKAIYALYRVFVILITDGKLDAAGADEQAKIVRTWLWGRLDSYTEFLQGLLRDEEKMLRVSAIQILFSLLKHLSTALTRSAPSSTPHPQFHVSFFKKIVYGLLVCPPSPRGRATGAADLAENAGILDADVRDTFIDTWFSVHDDIRWFFLREAVPILASNPSPNASANLLSILERLTTFPTTTAELNAWWVAELGAKPPKVKGSKSMDDAQVDADEDETSDKEDAHDDWRKFFDEEDAATATPKTVAASARLHKMTVHQSLHALPSHRAVFTRAWLALLPRLSTTALSLRALTVMHRGVLPHLTRPVLVMDWVSASVDHGGTVGLLALNALFELMKGYNLDYPSFYTRLYAFLDRDVLHAKHRARFFRLAEVFLSSTHLPATILASFVKRLARLSLTAPPAAVVMVVPFVYNVLKRHPALMVMIHRVEVDSEVKDPFRAADANPLTTCAIDSSLWELHAQETHYHSAVSTLAKIFGEAFTKPGYAMEDFLDHGYGTLLDTEFIRGRRIKKEPALGMDMRTDLFSAKGGVGEEGGGDVVNELWAFS
ncbi:hypothetical protein PLICRDRAFT_118099 [Plicaturopsis crispa FD-325 SS-3]|uniref:CCAAT-binding factor domain-containing protein n=1 Tax=Plicaturopsis crispa FD-325 SS-3 TaxID=944288 RepID=A0A0C9SXE6_PLICR|nr:hypothetical protein PLICRDRAFT_118099 [Plicaturopsis crispa FD-325 SS-3]